MRSTVRLEKGLGIDGSRLPRVPVTASSPQKTMAARITHPERDCGRMTTTRSSRLRWNTRPSSHLAHTFRHRHFLLPTITRPERK